MAGQKHVVVIGAGVTGLTTAVFLGEAGYRVTIVAAHVPGDSSVEYTSPWAGAHWLPHSTPATPRECNWDVQTYDYWLKMLENEGRDLQLPRSGIKQILSMNFWDEPPSDDDLWWAPYVDNFCQLSPDNEPLKTVNTRTPEQDPKSLHGAAYNAMTINVPRYLLYLQEKARSLGAAVIKARLPIDAGLPRALQSAAELATSNERGDVDVFVSATGLGARTLCGDEAMYPIRGQTVLVKGENHATITRVGDGYRAYCIPRPGSNTTILGGTKDIGAWDETPDPKTTERILRQNAWHCPELLTGEDGGFEVLSVQCGLRPARDGGPRVECEQLGKWRVVHAYGHAGAGYQNSVGCARDVVALVERSISSEAVGARL